MTILSDEIKDFLDTIYFYEIAHNTYPIDNLTPVYNLFLDKLSSIESFPKKKHKRSRTFPFSRDNMFGVIFGRYEFGYYYDGNTVYISGYRRKGNRTNDWLDSIIKESVRHITQSQLCRIVESAVREVLNKQMLNETYASNTAYEIIDGDRIDMRHESLAEKGWFNDIRMYHSPNMTYCLLRRCDNGKYFYAKIVPAPELGKDETKFKAVPYKSVPPLIRQDSQSLLRKVGTLRSGILTH